MIIITQFTQNIVRARSMLHPYYEGYRSVTPQDAARVNRTIFHNNYLVCALILYTYITLIKCRDYTSNW